MAFIRDWEKDLSEKSNKELEEISNALKVLTKWPLFRKEFQGIESLRAIIRGIKASRKSK